ncbi:hypothetical protein C8R45DRAFT_921120 [Mycena sanguinolenta]|nr:hypothetical protein C8R45DRAFT_947721 [Mycena sanguinolenta]KAJ6513491.1 hypothetical protein C8R45DRAFT_921120 [Mycena sanguinolenta]
MSYGEQSSSVSNVSGVLRRFDASRLRGTLRDWVDSKMRIHALAPSNATTITPSSGHSRDIRYCDPRNRGDLQGCQRFRARRRQIPIDPFTPVPASTTAALASTPSSTNQQLSPAGARPPHGPLARVATTRDCTTNALRSVAASLDPHAPPPRRSCRVLTGRAHGIDKTRIVLEFAKFILMASLSRFRPADGSEGFVLNERTSRAETSKQRNGTHSGMEEFEGTGGSVERSRGILEPDWMHAASEARQLK